MALFIALIGLTAGFAALGLSLIWGLALAVGRGRRWYRQHRYLQTFKTLIHSVLSPQEEAIAVLHYGLGGPRLVTADEIAQQLGLSRTQVLRARTMTVWKLQEGFASRGLSKWMPIVYGALEAGAKL
jgi:hypothetical protein